MDELRIKQKESEHEQHGCQGLVNTGIAGKGKLRGAFYLNDARKAFCENVAELIKDSLEMKASR